MQELNSIRVVMSKDHWNQWLKFAREEKKRRNLKPIVHESTQSSHPEDARFISASNAAIHTASQYNTNHLQQTRESQKYQPKTLIQQNEQQTLLIPDVSSSRPRGHPSKPIPNTISHRHNQSSSENNLAHSQPLSSNTSTHYSSSVPHAIVSLTKKHPTQVLGESGAPKRSTIPSSPSFTQSSGNGKVKSPSSPPTYAHIAPNIPSSTQTKLLNESVKIPHRMSAPADKISEPGFHSFSKQLGGKKVISMSHDDDKNHHDNEMIRKDYNGFSSNTSPLSNRHQPQTSAGMISPPDHFKRQGQHPAQKHLSSPSPVLALSPSAHKPATSDATPHTVPDIVKSSTLRIESAFAAAQSLKASLEADLESGSVNSEK